MSACIPAREPIRPQRDREYPAAPELAVTLRRAAAGGFGEGYF